MRAVIVSLVVLLVPVAAGAEDTQTIWAAGMGSEFSCGQVVAALEEYPALGRHGQLKRDGKTFVSEKAAVMQYVAGFVTGVNTGRDSSHQIMVDSEATELWIKNYCTAHPTENLFRAALAFAISQAGGRPK